MAEKIIRTIIQLRRDTEANWTVSEYVAKAGEPMVTLDGEHKGHIKMGDGESLWSALPYITDGSGTPINIEVDGTSIASVENVLGLNGFADATAGQQPRKGENGSLEWYTPDTSSVSGLQEAVGQLQTDVDTIESNLTSVTKKVTNLETVVGNENAGLVKDVADNKTNIESVANNLTNNYDTSEKVDEKIANAIGSVYKVGGSVASIDDIVVDAAHEGYVYNVTSGFTTTDAFVEGAGVEYPAGTNVVVIEIPGDPASYKLDVMSGFIDIPEEKIYYVNNICKLSTSAPSNDIISAIGSWDALYKAIKENNIIVDAEVIDYGEGKERINPKVAINVVAQNNTAIHLSFHTGIQVILDCEIQNNGDGTLAIAVTEFMISNDSDVKANKTIIDSLPDQFITDIVNVSRTETTNTAEIRIFTKQEDGTYSSEEKHGVLTLIGADATGAGLLTSADKAKLDKLSENTVTGVQVNGTLLDVLEGVVNIPVATVDTLGVVKSSADENKVSVDADGIMEVNNINVNKLVVSDDDQFIIDGGGANS